MSSEKNGSQLSITISNDDVYDSPKSKSAYSIVDYKSLEEKSDEAYRQITNRIIDITEKKLESQISTKEKIRKPLSKFLPWFLIAQFAVLCIILFLNSCCFHLSDSVINTYIVSVFAETLVGFIIMIRFAFNMEQEVNLIGILNAIVSKFQKYKDHHHDNDKKDK